MEILATLFENAPDAILLADKEGRILRVNPACERHLGYARGELPGMLVEDLIPARFRAGHRRNRAEYMGHPEPRPMGLGRDLTALRKDGTEWPVDITLNRITTPEGDFAMAILRDITDRRKAEAVAEEARGMLREFFEFASEGIFVADREGTYTDVNSAGCRLLGMPREEIVGKTIMDFIPPEDFDRLREARVKLDRGEANLETWHMRRLDGNFIPVEISTKIFPDGRWQAFVRDISERVKAEDAQRDLIRRLRDSLREIKVLRGLLPICSYCKRIRDEAGAWQQVEEYVRDHSQANFSHGICPACLAENFPGYVEAE